MFFKTAALTLALTAISDAIPTIQDRASNSCGTGDMAACASPEAASKMTGSLMSHTEFWAMLDYYDISLVDGFNVPWSNQQWCNQQPICCTEHTVPGQGFDKVGVTCVPITGAVPKTQKRDEGLCGVGDKFACVDDDAAPSIIGIPLSASELQKTLDNYGESVADILMGTATSEEGCGLLQTPMCCSSTMQNGKTIINCTALPGLIPKTQKRDEGQCDVNDVSSCVDPDTASKSSSDSPSPSQSRAWII